MTDTISREKAIDLAAKRAEEWFKVHADQRLRLFNFYVILVAAAVAGFVSSLSTKIYPFTIVISVVLLIVTIAFKSLDRRVAELVKVAEQAHDKIDALISSQLGMDELRIAKISDKKNGTISYRQSFNIIFLLGTALAIGGAAIAIASWVNPDLLCKP